MKKNTLSIFNANMDDLNKDPNLIVHTTNPVNAEPPLHKLREEFITPQEEFYIRNHGDIPQIDITTYRLKVNGLVERELELSLDQIKNNFPKHTVMATLQCAGNRRTELITVAPIPGEVPWREGAIGNTFWSGAPLREILLAAGLKENALYAEFMGADDVFRHGENVGFGASIPIDKALTDDVLLCYEMNGQPLEPTHGFPLRMIVPGYIGARSVKWLRSITLLTEPSKNYFQDHAYRLFPPEANPSTVDWESGIQISELNLNCVITSPANEAVLTSNSVTIQGYALSSGKEILKVEVSTDGGTSWAEATITAGDQPWAWSFWEVRLFLTDGAYDLAVRAFDSEGKTQPADLHQVWNFKGYMNNAWHRVKVFVRINN